MENLSLILTLAGLIYVVLIVVFYLILSSINKNQLKTVYMLKKIYEKDGSKLSDADLKFINK
ncbi:MAG: hypothetical protein K9I84_03545 [Leadbetterella sp.]|nr:hypothetical protein [Leadbetterella sp.]